jgi:hypothetical protein
MLEKFPAAAGPLAAWQLAARPLGLKGEILLEFEAGNVQGPGLPFLYYFAGGAWKTGEPKAGHCGERTCTYSVSVPYSQYYAIGLK